MDTHMEQNLLETFVKKKKSNQIKMTVDLILEFQPWFLLPDILHSCYNKHLIKSYFFPSIFFLD